MKPNGTGFHLVIIKNNFSILNMKELKKFPYTLSIA